MNRLGNGGLYRLILALGSIVNRLLKVEGQSPKQIGEYRLLFNRKKSDSTKNLSIGIYQKNGKKYFVKTWTGRLKDLGYYFLVNEFELAKIIEEEFARHSKLLSSTPVEIIKNSNQVHVVYCFIEAKSLTEVTKAIQLQTLEKVYTELEKVSQKSHILNKLLPHLSKGHYSFTLVTVAIGLIVRSPKLARNIIRKCWLCAQLLYKENPAMSLAHRDLTPENIMVDKDKIYLIDGEDYVYTFDGYDEIYLMTLPDKEEFSTKLKAKKTGGFLKNYLPLHHLIGGGDFGHIDKNTALKVLESYEN